MIYLDAPAYSTIAELQRDEDEVRHLLRDEAEKEQRERDFADRLDREHEVSKESLLYNYNCHF